MAFLILLLSLPAVAVDSSVCRVVRWAFSLQRIGYVPYESAHMLTNIQVATFPTQFEEGTILWVRP